MKIGYTSVAICAAALVVGAARASSAEASPRLRISGAFLAAVQSLGSQNICFKYSFDKNGNRISKTNITWGSATWGSTVFGCFNWSG